MIFLIKSKNHPNNYGRFCTDHFHPFLDLTIPGPGVYNWVSLYYDVVFNIMYTFFHSTIRRMQMVSAVGSSTPLIRLKTWNMLSACPISKIVCFIKTFLPIGILIFFFPLVGGWAIPRRQLIKKSPIGKGEFGGERESEREGGRKGERILVTTTFFLTEVWLGEYQSSKVAIKMLKDLRDAKASQLFLREASVMT